MIHVPSTQQAIDILTKSFEKTNFARCQQMFGLLILWTNKFHKDKWGVYIQVGKDFTFGLQPINLLLIQ